ncbi:cysteine--tRNA ligase [Phaeobacter gallaeciensis]|uniref:Cysteine--tRNA ligase n=2 Tax=Roseobacteraceae TaxID=2854170 RepID=A0A366WTY4_9RHOB|nr:MULTISPECIES: cysteine--tRNA ligase [Roseobacteraceae]MBT3140638.1 cysteine--tRNA ligase [Falsiruegeria litorea]MBT8170377.1 cysteine--tRNA ligase [Falsiruegeria litorea]RBW52607.1 cysteine--tRNA ligase [Phaeobacter gallaeciensis]
MTTIKLHNTKSRKKEGFVPIDANNVRMYVCGPTVYDRAHIGNARPVVVFDVLYRLLREVYGADHVTYVRNFTDVDDKINATAQARKEAGAKGTLEELVRERTEETIDWYLKDMGELGAMQPNHMPRATQYIAQMIAMNEDLITKGHAYAAEGHVLFAVDSWKEHYGKLSGRSVDDMIAGARVEVAPYKRNPMDFVLWKPSTAEQPGWESPWGRGRPGWHIECSAMAKELLGVNFDIHGGGNDLMFPHHENEIAQSCCADPDGGFANYWLHNEMLQVEGKKMSKSLGNFFTVRDLLEQGVPGEVIRFVFLSTHYRKPMDWTEKKAKQAKEFLMEIWSLVSEAEPTQPSPKVIEALSDDLNTPLALSEIHTMVTAVKSGTGDAGELYASMQLLGQFNFQPSISVYGWGPFSEDQINAATRLVHRWMAFRNDKDYDSADALKSKANTLGVELTIAKQSGAQVGTAKFHRNDVIPQELEEI